MSVRFCQKCGIPVDEGDVYCYLCGALLQIKVPSDGSAAAGDSSGYCSRCGQAAYAGDRYCPHCGTDQTVTPKPEKVNDDEEEYDEDDTPAPPRRNLFRLLFRTITAILFWGAVIAVCYAAYKYLLSDIPWGDVVAVVTGQRRDADDDRIRSSDLPSIDVVSASVSLPPVAPESVSSDTETADSVFPARVKPVWAEQDEDGYSALVSGDGSQTSAELSVRGIITGDKVRLRAGPDTKARVIGTFSKNTDVEITRRFSSGREKFVWYNVRVEKDSGWMYGEFIQVMEDE